MMWKQSERARDGCASRRAAAKRLTRRRPCLVRTRQAQRGGPVRRINALLLGGAALCRRQIPDGRCWMNAGQVASLLAGFAVVSGVWGLGPWALDEFGGLGAGRRRESWKCRQQVR